MKNCPKCGVEHAKLGTHCSRSCANSRGPRNDEFKNKVRKKLTGRKGHTKNQGNFRVERLTKNCHFCQNEFVTTATQQRKYCSKSCWAKKAGGYRPGSGRAKSGYYKGIYCGSTYELVWLIYRIDHNLPCKRFEGILEYQNVRYIPDFIIDDTIVEIKGFESDVSVDKKSNVAEKLGYKVLVLRRDNLITEFEWVKQNYKYKKLYELYDGYKPQYNLNCASCNSIVARNSKPKTEIVFCSRHCAGKGHRGRIKFP